MDRKHEGLGADLRLDIQKQFEVGLDPSDNLHDGTRNFRYGFPKDEFNPFAQHIETIRNELEAATNVAAWKSPTTLGPCAPAPQPYLPVTRM